MTLQDLDDQIITFFIFLASEMIVLFGLLIMFIRSRTRRSK